MPVLLITLWVAMNSGFASAVGLGNVYLKSKLHQPLDAEIELTEIQDLNTSEIFPNLASVADFDRAGVYRPAILAELKFQTILRSDGTGFIKVTSQKPIEEPFLDFLVEVHWPNGRLLREYTLLMDPPVFERQVTSPAQPQMPSGARSYAVPDHNKRLNSRKNTRPAAIDPSAPQYPGRSQSAGEFQGVTYKVKGNESLSQVAERVRPDGQVSVEQTMIALLRLNPEAFAGYNINRLKKGVVLNVPDLATSQALTHRQAVWQVAMHHEAWQKRKSLPMPGNSRQERLATVMETSRPSVRSASVESGREGEGKNLLQSELMLSREQVDQLAEENGELRGKLQNLDQQLNSLNELVMQQDDQMTAIQASEFAKETSEPEAVTRTEAVVSDSSSQDEPEQQQKLEEKQEHEERPVDSIPAESTPAVVPLPVVTSQPDFFGSLLFYALLLMLPLATAIGFIVYRRYRSENELDEDLLDVLDLDLSEEAETEESSEAGKLTGDPLVDADTHVTYGRFAEAVSLLKQAIEKEPARTDLIVKLLEVHGENNDLDSFKAVFAQLESMGNPDALKSAEVYRSRFPADAFVTKGESVPKPETKPEPVRELGGMDLDLNEMEEDFDPGALDEFALDLNDIASEPEADVSKKVSEPEIAFDLSDTAPESTPDDEPVAPEPAASLDFDLSDGFADTEPRQQAESEPALDIDENHGLDFDTSGLGLTDKPEEAEDNTEAGSEVPGLDFDVGDLNLDVPPQENAEASLDMGDAAVEFESTGAAPAPAASQPVADFDDDLGFDDELDDLNYLADDDEVAIKLDLARAYIDMGDKEGASDILDEVLEQGSTEQRAEARTLLDQL